MEIEQLEIRDFLGQCSPLNKLDSAVVDEITNALEIEYQRRDDLILKTGEVNHFLYLIRSGAVEILDEKNQPYSHLESGDWFGYRSILRGGTIQMQAKALSIHCFIGFQKPCSGNCCKIMRRSNIIFPLKNRTAYAVPLRISARKIERRSLARTRLI